jgi:hypothetical protein
VVEVQGGSGPIGLGQIGGHDPGVRQPGRILASAPSSQVGGAVALNHLDQDATGEINQTGCIERCNLTLPTLLVRGGLSDVLTEEGASEFLELCPHAEYVNMEGAAHMVAGDRNDIFSSAVIDFLSRTVPVDGTPVQAPHRLTPRHLGPPGDLTDVP